MDAQSSQTPDNLVDQLRFQLSTTRNRVAFLQREMYDMQADFDYKESKMKEQYFEKEGDARQQNLKLLDAGRQLSAMESTIHSLQEEIENVKMIASVSENTKEEAVQDLNRHHQEEIESLRQVLHESMEEQRRELVVQFEQERRRWEQEKTEMKEEKAEAKIALSKFENSSQIKRIEENDNKKKESELNMKKAQIEAETLKAVVLPLEAEIAELKAKLKQATKSEEHSRNKIGELSYSLSVEKSSRSDLELYVEILRDQMVKLDCENDNLKFEKREVFRLLEREVEEHSLLKQTWRAANKEFISSQKLHRHDIEAVKSVICRKQCRRTKLLQLRNEARGFASVSPDSSPTWPSAFCPISFNPNQLSVNDQAAITSLKLTTMDTTEISRVPTITYHNEANDDDSFTPFQSYPTEQIPPSSTLESKPTASQDSLSISSVSSLPSSAGLVPVDLGQTQRVLSAPHLDRLGGDQSTHKGKKPRAWDEIASISTERSESPQECLEFACTASHADKELISSKEKCMKLQEEATELRKLLDKERNIRIQVEESVAHASEEAQKQIIDLTKKLTDLEGRIEEDTAWRKRKETEYDQRLSSLQRERENFYEEFLQIKKENDRVKAFYDKHRLDLNKEPVLAPNVEGLGFQVRKYREALLAARVEKSHVESRLQSKLGFMQERLNAEQVEKEQLHITLSAELDHVKKELASLRNVKEKLHIETSEKRDLLAQAEKDQISFDSIRNKSKEIIKGLREKLKTETTSKEELESKLSATKNQVSSLQDALKTSEQVQQDFVRLSQSLQMKLEEIRQREEGGFLSKFNSHPASNQTDLNLDLQSTSRKPD